MVSMEMKLIWLFLQIFLVFHKMNWTFHFQMVLFLKLNNSCVSHLIAARSIKIKRNSEPNWEQEQIQKSSYKFLCGISAADADLKSPIAISLPHSVEIPKTEPFIYSTQGIICMKLR